MIIRFFTIVVAFLIGLAANMKIVAQAEQGTGPTLAETTDFLNQKLQQRGKMSLKSSTISFEGFSGAGCEQTYREIVVEQRSPGVTEASTVLSLLRLDQSDLASVTILQPDENVAAFRVAVNKIAHNTQSIYQAQPSRPFNMTARDLVFITVKGRAQSVDGVSMTILPENSGIPIQVIYDRSVEFYAGPWDTPLYEGPKNKKTWRYNRRESHWTDVGIGDNVELHSLLEGGSSRNRIFFEKSSDATAPALPDPEVLSPATRQIGPERKQFVFGYSKDKDDAERLAKAIIHAIVLCQANAKPSLF